MVNSSHVLDCGDLYDFKYLAAKRGRKITPEVIVIHYGVTHNLSSLVAAQRARGYWAHLSIDGFTDGERGRNVYQVRQAMPFNEMGSHAGKSSYEGRPSVNSFSIGIEIANPGPLERGKDGKLRTVYGKLWPEDEAEAHQHPNLPASHPWKHWAHYTDQELDILIDICRTLRAKYPSIVDIVGHDEIAPGRKFDPGPAFPIDYLKSKVLAP